MPTRPWVTLLPPSSSDRLRPKADCCSLLMLRCIEAYRCCKTAAESRDRKEVRMGSMEMSGMMPASRATEKSSWTVPREGIHKPGPVRIIASSFAVCVAQVCVRVCLCVKHTVCRVCVFCPSLSVFVCPLLSAQCGVRKWKKNYLLYKNTIYTYRNIILNLIFATHKKINWDLLHL